jgi:hypothetical protein
LLFDSRSSSDINRTRRRSAGTVLGECKHLLQDSAGVASLDFGDCREQFVNRLGILPSLFRVRHPLIQRTVVAHRRFLEDEHAGAVWLHFPPPLSPQIGADVGQVERVQPRGHPPAMNLPVVEMAADVVLHSSSPCFSRSGVAWAAAVESNGNEARTEAVAQIVYHVGGK